jgi:hypothetical protein
VPVCTPNCTQDVGSIKKKCLHPKTERGSLDADKLLTLKEKATSKILANKRHPIPYDTSDPKLLSEYQSIASSDIWPTLLFWEGDTLDID